MKKVLIIMLAVAVLLMAAPLAAMACTGCDGPAGIAATLAIVTVSAPALLVSHERAGPGQDQRGTSNDYFYNEGKTYMIEHWSGGMGNQGAHYMPMIAATHGSLYAIRPGHWRMC